MSEKTYTFIFPDGDAVERPFRCTQDAIDCAKEEFDGVERVIIGREITEYHDIGTVENGVFTAATQEPTLEDCLLKALENVVSCFNANDSDSMANAVADAVAAIAKANGGAL